MATKRKAVKRTTKKRTTAGPRKLGQFLDNRISDSQAQSVLPSPEDWHKLKPLDWHRVVSLIRVTVGEHKATLSANSKGQIGLFLDE